IAPLRGMAADSHVTERVVSQLLTELDGLQPMHNVVFIATTNRPDMIDPAVLRPGRIDKMIFVPPPDRDARLEILKVHTRRMPLDKDVDLEEIATLTEGYSGADLAALVREAGLRALRENMAASKVSRRHFDEALQTVKPSLSKEGVEFYIRWYEQLRRAGVARKVETSPYA
ncbi:MAG: AAA family ATPase, partial [Fervidicoccaceae archaeon]